MYTPNRQMGQPEQKEPPDFLSGYAPYYHHKKPSGINPTEAVRVMGQLIPGMTDIPPEGKRKLMDTLLRYGQEQKRQRKTPDYEWVPGKGAVPFESVESAPHDSVSPTLRALGKAGTGLGASALDYLGRASDFHVDPYEEKERDVLEIPHGYFQSLAKKARNTLNDLTNNASVKNPFSYHVVNKSIDNLIKNETGRNVIKQMAKTNPVLNIANLFPEEIPESMIWETIFNVDNLAPIGIAKKGAAAARIGKSALAGGGINAVLSAGHVLEREDLTKEQKAVAVGLSVLIGSLFGGGVSALSKGAGKTAEKAAVGTAGQFLKKLKGKLGKPAAESEAALPVLSAADDLLPAQPYAAPSGGKDPFPLSGYEVDPDNIPPYLLNRKSSAGSDAHVYAPEFDYPAGQTAGKADGALKTLPRMDSNSPDVKYHKLKNDDFVPVSNDKKIRAVISKRPEDSSLLGKYTQEWAEENLPHNIDIAGTGGPLKGRNVVLSREGMGRFNQAYITNAQAESIILLDDIIKNGVPFKTEPNINPAKKNIVAVHHLLTRVQLDNNPYLAKTTLYELKNGDLVYHGHEIRQIGKAGDAQGLSPASVPQSGTHANNAVLKASPPVSNIVDDVANVNPKRWFPDDLNKMFNIPATGAGLQNSQIFKAAYDQIKIKNLENPAPYVVAGAVKAGTLAGKPLGAAGKTAIGAAERFLKKLKGKAGTSAAESEAAALRPAGEQGAGGAVSEMAALAETPGSFADDLLNAQARQMEKSAVPPKGKAAESYKQIDETMQDAAVTPLNTNKVIGEMLEEGAGPVNIPEQPKFTPEETIKYFETQSNKFRRNDPLLKAKEGTDAPGDPLLDAQNSRNVTDPLFAVQRPVQSVLPIPSPEALAVGRQILSEEKNLMETAQKLLSGNYGTDMVAIGRTPELYRRMGMDDLPMKMLKTDAEKVLGIKSKGRNIHNITPEDFSKLPRYLADPVMVMVSKKFPDRYIVLTDAFEKVTVNGRTEYLPVIAIINPGRATRPHVFINDIPSMYGKKGIIEVMEYAAEHNGVSYLNAKKVTNLLRHGLRLPAVNSGDFLRRLGSASTKNLVREGDLVKPIFGEISHPSALIRSKGKTWGLLPFIGAGMAGGGVDNSMFGRNGSLEEATFGPGASKDAERFPPARQMTNHVQDKGTFGLEDLKALMRKKYQSENSKKMPDWMKRRLEAEKLKKAAN